MPAEVLSNRLELLLKCIWRYQNNEDKDPFEYACRARDWQASRPNECIEDEDGRVLRARRRWKDPVKAKELLRLRATSTWIERTFISSRDRRGHRIIRDVRGTIMAL
jgi:hypothetical protein